MRRKILAVLVVLCLCELALATDPNLVAHWEFDEGTGDISYDSAGAYGGMLVGGPDWVTGQIGEYALDFDGVDDYVDTNSADLDLAGTDTITVSAWICPKEQTYDVGHLVNDYDKNNTLGWHVTFGPGNTFRAVNADFTKSRQRQSSVLSLNQWYHAVAIIYPVGLPDIYVNGQLDNNFFPSGAPTTQLYMGSGNVLIGRQSKYTTPERFFNGKMDDVRIYKRALSAEEIEQLYQDGAPKLVWLEITGPNQIGDKRPVQYLAIAHYDDNSTKDVTDLADWLVDPNIYCSIDNIGVLTPEQINTLQQNVAIHVQYTENSDTVIAQKDVTILSICPTGSALQFDGVDDYVDCGNATSLKITGDEITVIAWININGSGINWPRIVLGGSVNEAYTLTKWNASDDRILWRPLLDGDMHKGEVTSSWAIPRNEWHMIAALYNSVSSELYIDGALSASTFVSGTLSTDSWNVLIGGEPLSHNSSNKKSAFDGKIDEVSIYNRALSAEEIQALLYTRPDTAEPNLIAYWDFDEGEGNIASDLSSNSNDGAIYGTAWSNDVPLTGICSLEEIVERNLIDVLDMKDNVIGILDAALAKEQIVLNMLNTVFKNRDFGDTPKKDVVRVKQKIHSAIQHERHAKKSVNRSINKLEDALAIFGIEPGDSESIPLAGEQTPMTADINADGVVDTRDFAIMAKYWLATCETE